MKRAPALFLVLFTLFVATSAGAKTPYLSADELQSEVQRDFEKILDLWRDGRYADLYARTVAGGRESKERFAKKLADAPRKPVCCWEKMQEVKITVKDDATALVRAKLGFEGGGETEFVTRTFKLRKEEGVWQLSQADIFSLASAAKKKVKHRKKAKKSDY